MLSWGLFCILAVVYSARRTPAFPVYTGTNMEPQTDLIRRLGSEVEEVEGADIGNHRQIKELHPFLLQLDNTRDAWMKGPKDYSNPEKMSNMVDDIKAVLLNLAAADGLRAHSPLRSDQSSPKANKRACFWKYCVTN